ncbi:pupal cuticle protein 27-like isoform X2 [Zophobas morio]|uniref:pupal cuticle protein 27-like isoform X2 n=1 Tax=Zophobas morio TaxID=2755281 RepID=UPI0030832E6F
MRFYFVVATVFTVASAQQYTTPVPILKQINKHNEDGSYSYGYEAADGTYKIETKYPDGEVFGKYGYIDDQGKLRTVEYGASRRGFEPAGNEIQVPPPTLKANNQYERPLGPNEEDDGQYREDPSLYYKNDPYSRAQPTQSRPQPSYSNFGFSSQPNYYNPPPQPAYPNHHPFQGHPATNVDINSGSYSVNYRK